MPETANNESAIAPGLHRFAFATSACTVLLLMAGALVTSNDAADSVPDWPLAYGKIIPPLVGGIRYEYAHRLMAGTVAILTLVLAILLARSGSRFLRNLGFTMRPTGATPFHVLKSKSVAELDCLDLTAWDRKTFFDPACGLSRREFFHLITSPGTFVPEAGKEVG